MADRGFVSVEVRGAEQMRLLGKKLRAAGLEGRGLRLQMLAEMRAAEKAALMTARASAEANLPKGGGLNTWVASSKFSGRNRLSGKGVGVTMLARKPGGTKGTHDLAATDAGHFRHPVFGHRDRWAPQSITAGWWSKPMTKVAVSLRIQLVAVMAKVARQIQE